MLDNKQYLATPGHLMRVLLKVLLCLAGLEMCECRNYSIMRKPICSTVDAESKRSMRSTIASALWAPIWVKA